MEKTAIMTDTNSGITPEEAKEKGVYLLPMIFFIEGKEYKECVNLTWDTFYGYLKEGREVSTTQPSLEEMSSMWDQLLTEYDKVIYIPMSKALSGTYEAAKLLSEDYDGRVLVEASTRISATQENTVFYAKTLADKGIPAQEIVRELEENDLNARIYITVDTLDYLRKSGRVSSFTAIAGDVLNIKPIIQIVGGLLEPIARIRGRKRAKKRMEDLLREQVDDFLTKFPLEELRIYIAHSAVEEEALEWGKELEEQYPKFGPVKVVKLPMSVCCHTGPGTIGTGGRSSLILLDRTSLLSI